jgi:hypothetical protein
MHALGVQYAAKEFTLQIEMKLLALLVKAIEETGINRADLTCRNRRRSEERKIGLVGTGDGGYGEYGAEAIKTN